MLRRQKAQGPGSWHLALFFECNMPLRVDETHISHSIELSALMHNLQCHAKSRLA